MAQYSDYLQYLQHVDDTTLQDFKEREKKLTDEMAAAKKKYNEELEATKKKHLDEIEKIKDIVHDFHGVWVFGQLPIGNIKNCSQWV